MSITFGEFLPRFLDLFSHRPTLGAKIVFILSYNLPFLDLVISLILKDAYLQAWGQGNVCTPCSCPFAQDLTPFSM